ncbi:MAG TPA: DUF2339 domain-containing protein, partial [Thermoanaerobaculia bacterium]|nr:DUF2339 domain-containing protein [Thermoanaerobaculia bacterium]
MFEIEGCIVLQLALLGFVVGLVVVLRLRRQMARLEARVRQLEEAGAGSPYGLAAAAPAATSAPGATDSPAGMTSAPGGPESEPLAPASATAATRAVPLADAAAPSAPGMAPPPPPAPSWEVRLGSRLPAWIGSIALTLAGAFLVKYSLDQGWLGPEIRVLLAAGFGLAAVLTGQRLARGTASAGLVAAGVAVLYAAVLAAATLYGLLPPWLGFLATAGITAWALLLALRHGAIVAVVGLLGGSLTPHLIQLGGPRPVTVAAYLLLLEIGLLQVSRRRGWTWLGPLSLLGLFAWALVADSAWSDAALLAGCFAAVAVLHRTRSALQRLTVTTALAGTLLLYAGGALASPMGRLDWIFLALLTTGMLVLGRLDERFEGLAWTAPALAALLLLLDADGLEPAGLPGYLATVTAFALVSALGGYAALWRSRRAEVWARLPAAAGPVAVLLAEIGIRQAGTAHAVLWPAHGAALVLGLAAVPLLRRRRRPAEPGGDGGSTEPDPRR